MGWCARVAALTPETELPRRRAAGSSPALADLATPSGVWLGIWCKRECSTCVIHLCAQSRGSGLGTACAAAGRVSAAAPAVVRACVLCGARVRVLESPRPCAEPRANPGGVRAWLRGAERRGMVLATARHGGAAARTPVTGVQPLEWLACRGNGRIR